EPAPRGRWVSPLAGAVAAGAAALVGGLVAKLVHDRRGTGEMEGEGDLVEPPRMAAAPFPRVTDEERVVEVDLEGRGFPSSPQPLTAERQYEVEMERPMGDPSGSTKEG